MVRVYSSILRCDSCGNRGPFGWLYRCSQDQEEILRNSILSGDEVTFDDLGKQLIAAVQPRNRGPEKRSGNAACFLEEMPSRDITTTYTSDQLLTIFNQRKHRSAYHFDDILGCTGSTPWVPNAKDECQYMICPYCRPGGADRAYISLDGVAEGSIPATAATGYGFHFFRQRPVCNSSLVANLGLRSDSVSTEAPASASFRTSSDSSNIAIVDARLASQLASQLNLPDRSPSGDRRGDSSWQDTTASTVSLPAAASAQLGKDPTEMEEHEKEEGKFLAKPLEVAHGVAVLEESVERHAPDLVTQG
ncbi:hypothetical protein Ct61P_13694 [Colletotrichum tofieldiae]|nr:hypothetical protein Ct61P_13694 [Colletotrichum tofieldiae]